jgi:tetratricopeptide (TPR) repeat protein
VTSLWRQIQDLALEDRAVAVGALGALATTTVQGLFETTGAEPANNFLLVMLIASALAPSAAQPLPRLSLRRFGAWAVLAAVVAGLGVQGLWLTASYQNGIAAAQRAEWARAVAALTQAVQREPRSALVWQQLGLAHSALALQHPTQHLPEAIAALEMAARLDPDWALNHANLGALYWAQGDATAAQQALREATHRAPAAALFHFNLGLVAEAAGDEAQARQAYQHVLELRPDWSPAYVWRATALRRAVWAEWQASDPASPRGTVAEWEADVAGHAAVATPYARLAIAYAALGRGAEAEQLVQWARLAAAFSPETRLEVQWAEAEVAASRGDLQRAVAIGEAVRGGLRAQSVYGPGSFGNASYGPFLFRRATMAMDLTPQLALPPLTDEWAVRLTRLAEWHGALGAEAQAHAVYQELREIAPDVLESQTH